MLQHAAHKVGGGTRGRRAGENTHKVNVFPCCSFILVAFPVEGGGQGEGTRRKERERDSQLGWSGLSDADEDGEAATKTTTQADEETVQELDSPRIRTPNIYPRALAPR